MGAYCSSRCFDFKSLLVGRILPLPDAYNPFSNFDWLTLLCVLQSHESFYLWLNLCFILSVLVCVTGYQICCLGLSNNKVASKWKNRISRNCYCFCTPVQTLEADINCLAKASTVFTSLEFVAGFVLAANWSARAVTSLLSLDDSTCYNTSYYFHFNYQCSNLYPWMGTKWIAWSGGVTLVVSCLNVTLSVLSRQLLF